LPLAEDVPKPHRDAGHIVVVVISTKAAVGTPPVGSGAHTAGQLAVAALAP